MCRKIRCDRESCKVLGFWVYLNKALHSSSRNCKTNLLSIINLSLANVGYCST